MKRKRSFIAALGVGALAASLPTAASASGSVTFSFGSDYDTPYHDARYYGDDAYTDYDSNADYADSYNDDAYDDDGYYHGGHSEDAHAVRPDYGRRTESDSRQVYRRPQRCTSGTTGAILGAVVGGLLGGEVGRGGYYNERSTTGAIIGAGGGALAGRAIARNGCR